MTTDLFFKAKTVFRGAPRPVPPNVVSLSVPRDGGSLVMSPDGLRPVAMSAPAPMPASPQYLGQGVPVSLEKKPADVETISLGPKATFVSTPGFDMMGTEEEKIGPRAKPASLVGGL